MDQVTRTFDTVLGYVLAFGAFCLTFVRQAEGFARARMTELGWTANVQTAVLVTGAVLLVLVLLRVFAPLLRLLLIVLLVVIALQFLHPETWRIPHAALPCGAGCAIGT